MVEELDSVAQSSLIALVSTLDIPSHRSMFALAANEAGEANSGYQMNSLDAAMTILSHISAHWRGASEIIR